MSFLSKNTHEISTKNTFCLTITLFISILGNAQNSTDELNEELPIGSDKSVVSGFYNRFDVGFWEVAQPPDLSTLSMVIELTNIGVLGLD